MPTAWKRIADFPGVLSNQFKLPGLSCWIVTIFKRKQPRTKGYKISSFLFLLLFPPLFIIKIRPRHKDLNYSIFSQIDHERG